MSDAVQWRRRCAWILATALVFVPITYASLWGMLLLIVVGSFAGGMRS